MNASNHISGDRTQTQIGNTAIAVPIYLRFEFDKTLIRVKQVGQGGEGSVWLCDLIDKSLIASQKATKVAAKIFDSKAFKLS